MYKYFRMAALLAIDACLIVCSVYLAYLLRFDFSIRKQFIITLPYVLSMFAILIIGSFYLFKIYKKIWKYASVSDLLAILKGAILGSGAFFLIHHFIVQPYIYPKYIVPRSIYLLVIIIGFLAVGGSRAVWRLIRDRYGRITPDHRKALIIGAGDAGVMVVRELRRTRAEQYPVAFIDDNDHKKNYEVMGIPVVGTRYDIPRVVKQFKINDIILAIPTASRTDIADIIKICKETRCQIKIVPRMNDLINGKITINKIRNVSVEDLLGREPVTVDMDEISEYLKNKVVLITGAGGSIGSEICRQIAIVEPKQLIVLGHGENSIYDIELELKTKNPTLDIVPIIADIQERSRIEQVFQRYRPQVVFHAAAHKHVPLMEANPIEAIKNNVFGTRNVAECADQYGANKFVLISTDKAVNPTSVMGATKHIAELIIQHLNRNSNTKFSAVRFGNVLGSRGSVIPLFRKQIEEGGPVTVTHPDMIRYFMTIPEAVQLVIQAGSLTKGGETFILDMGQPVKIAELAHDLIRLSGFEPGKDIKIVYTGLRPGEKLFEEILSKEEGATATKHDRIFIGHSSVEAIDNLPTQLQELERIINNENIPDHENLKLQLKSIVPTYHWGDEASPINHTIIKEKIQASLEMVAALENN